VEELPKYLEDGMIGSGDQTELRGKVQHVSSGEARYFRDWPTLIAFLQVLLSAPRSPHQ